MRPVKQEKPPRQNRGGQKDPTLSALALEGIPAHSVVGFRGDDAQTLLLNQYSGDEPSDRVSLPAGGFHQIRSRGSAGSLQQVKEFRGLAAVAAASGIFCRLSRRRPGFGFLSWGGLFARLALRRRHVARTCADTGLFGRSWRRGRGRCFAISGIFWNYVHCDFSLGGDYRDDHINHSGPFGLQAKSDGGGRW
jgi:hypothetical protein